jgi:glutathione S-transferase
MPSSGNCYKVTLAATQLGIALEETRLDVREGTTRTDDFLALNPNGRVPLLILDDGTPLAESNAILFHLADRPGGSPLLPEDRRARALILQRCFFEQYSHEPFIATNRYWIHLAGEAEARAARIAENHERGLAALGVMETHLARHDWFVEACSIADVTLFAYTHVAHEGGYDLAPFPAVRAWIERVRATDGFVPMPAA